MSPRTSAVATSPRRTTAPAREQVRPRPALRVVDPDELRRLRPGRVGTIAGTVLFVAMFALAAFQTLIIKEQGTLDDLNERIRSEELRQRDLELALVDLQSPARITEAAHELGMITPGAITYLQPKPDDDAAATFVEPEPVPTTSTTTPKPAPSTSTTAPRSRSTSTTSTTTPKPRSTSTTTPKAPSTSAPAKSGTGR